MDAVKRLFGVSIRSKSAQSQANIKVIFQRSSIPPHLPASSVSDGVRPQLMDFGGIQRRKWLLLTGLFTNGGEKRGNRG
jgi:hypothetical protein